MPELYEFRISEKSEELEKDESISISKKISTKKGLSLSIFSKKSNKKK